jgi:glutathione S-transferase/GST-like protein
MAGQRNHFRSYAPTVIPDQRQVAYGAIRYTNEVERLYGVLDTQLAGRDFITGEYSIADMICWPWVNPQSNSSLNGEDFPNLRAWHARVGERPAVQRALAKGDPVVRASLTQSGPEGDRTRAILFGQRARR